MDAPSKAIVGEIVMSSTLLAKDMFYTLDGKGGQHLFPKSKIHEEIGKTFLGLHYKTTPCLKRGCKF